MKNRSNYNSIKGMKVLSFLVDRHLRDYELIEPEEFKRICVKEKRHIISKKLDIRSVRCTVLSGTVAFALINSAMLLMQNKKKTSRILTLAAGTAIPAAIGGLAACILDKVSLYEIKNKKFNEYVLRYAEVERTLSESISDDTRLTRGAMMYRRDLRDAIQVIGRDLGHKGCLSDYCCFEYSHKSKKQLISSFCAEFGDIHAEFVSDLENSEIFEIVGAQIVMEVDNEDALKRINNAHNRIEKVFAVFGLKPVFCLRDL